MPDQDREAKRQDFYNRIDGQNMTPLWTVLSDLVTPHPQSACQPFGWHFRDIRAAMTEAGELITAREAERRVLILENPGLRGQSRITTCLYAGVQLVLPGEIAPAHRHTQSALRFVLEGSGAYTAVNGEKTEMQVGDFVITPHMAWHDHGNETDQPMFWLDGLDIPLVRHLDVSFAEMLDEEAQPVERHTGQSYDEFGYNLQPIDHQHKSHASPIFNYPYSYAREALDKLSRSRDPDPYDGWKMRYTNPIDGGWAMPTIGSCIQLLPKGRTQPRRATDATVYSCVEGGGRSFVDGTEISWGPQDIFVVPAWREVIHDADTQSVLFSFSDRPVQEKLGFWREQRGNSQEKE